MATATRVSETEIKKIISTSFIGFDEWDGHLYWSNPVGNCVYFSCTVKIGGINMDLHITYPYYDDDTNYEDIEWRITHPDKEGIVACGDDIRELRSKVRVIFNTLRCFSNDFCDYSKEKQIITKPNVANYRCEPDVFEVWSSFEQIWLYNWYDSGLDEDTRLAIDKEDIKADLVVRYNIPGKLLDRLIGNDMLKLSFDPEGAYIFRDLDTTGTCYKGHEKLYQEVMSYIKK